MLAIIGKQTNNNISFSQLCGIIFNISKNVHDDDQEMVIVQRDGGGASSNSTGLQRFSRESAPHNFVMLEI